MGYYGRGDYYRGDYYRGDPGFFSSLGSALGHIGSGIIDLGTGNIGGAVTQGLQAIGIGGPGAPPQPPGTTITKMPLFGGLFGGTTTTTTTAAPGAKGYHLNKAKLYPSRAHPQGAAKGTVLVRNRHMHVTNPRALARASRRAHGFLRMARKFVRYYEPKAHKGKAYIGRRKRGSR